MGVSTDTALRLAKYFGTTPNVWLNLQNDYDISVGTRELKRELAAIRPSTAANNNLTGRRTPRRQH